MPTNRVPNCLTECCLLFTYFGKTENRILCLQMSNLKWIKWKNICVIKKVALTYMLFLSSLFIQLCNQSAKLICILVLFVDSVLFYFAWWFVITAQTLLVAQKSTVYNNFLCFFIYYCFLLFYPTDISAFPLVVCSALFKFAAMNTVHNRANWPLLAPTFRRRI